MKMEIQSSEASTRRTTTKVVTEYWWRATRGLVYYKVRDATSGASQDHDPDTGQFVGSGGGSVGDQGAIGPEGKKGAIGADLASTSTSYTKEEKQALGHYADESALAAAARLNPYYRNGRKGPIYHNVHYKKTALTADELAKLDASIDLINSAIKKSPLAADEHVFRGIAQCNLSRELNKNADAMVGKTVPMSGFQSTSLDEKTAQDYLGGQPSPVILNILVPKGNHSVDMRPVADQGGRGGSQKEQLLAPGTFKVEKVEWVEAHHGKKILHMSGTYADG
jgi:hypothetical protein